MSSETNDPSPALQRKTGILFMLHSLFKQAAGLNMKQYSIVHTTVVVFPLLLSF